MIIIITKKEIICGLYPPTHPKKQTKYHKSRSVLHFAIECKSNMGKIISGSQTQANTTYKNGQGNGQSTILLTLQLVSGESLHSEAMCQATRSDKRSKTEFQIIAFLRVSISVFCWETAEMSTETGRTGLGVTGVEDEGQCRLQVHLILA